MQVLKIKDKINLKELENIGFEFLTTDENSMVYFLNKERDDTDYWEISKDRVIRYINILYSKNPETSLLSATRQIGVSCNIQIPAFVYYLIKCDFVEVAEV